jgi:biotin carboxyl carrier protein
MNYELKIGRRIRTVKVTPVNSFLEFRLDGQGVAAEVMEVEPNVFSVLLSGQAFEVRIHQTPQGTRVYVDGREYAAELNDPRQWRRGAGGASSAEGRQNIFAPMPGKVVRVLVQAGATVKPGQGLLVVEAMKMQNEIKSTKEGTVERIHVQEGQAVNAGEALAVIA